MEHYQSSLSPLIHIREHNFTLLEITILSFTSCSIAKENKESIMTQMPFWFDMHYSSFVNFVLEKNPNNYFPLGEYKRNPNAAPDVSNPEVGHYEE